MAERKVGFGLVDFSMYLLEDVVKNRAKEEAVERFLNYAQALMHMRDNHDFMAACYELKNELLKYAAQYEPRYFNEVVDYFGFEHVPLVRCKTVRSVASLCAL